MSPVRFWNHVLLTQLWVMFSAKKVSPTINGLIEKGDLPSYFSLTWIKIGDAQFITTSCESFTYRRLRGVWLRFTPLSSPKAATQLWNFRGTQPLFSVKYLYLEKQILPKIFYNLRTAKNFYMTVPFMYNFWRFSNKSAILVPRLGYFRSKKET